MQESRNLETQKVCVGLEQRRAQRDGCAHKFFSRPVPEDKGTCGFVQRVPTRAQRAISVQKKNDPKTGRSVDPTEVGGLHQLVS